MQYIVFRFKDTSGRKGSKTTCTPARHSFLTLLSASCSWQQINCVVVIWGLFLFISFCGASQDSPRACRCPVQGAWAMLGAVPGVCRAPPPAKSCPTACPGLHGPPWLSGALRPVELRVLHRQLRWLQCTGIVKYSGRSY